MKSHVNGNFILFFYYSLQFPGTVSLISSFLSKFFSFFFLNPGWLEAQNSVSASLVFGLQVYTTSKSFFKIYFEMKV